MINLAEERERVHTLREQSQTGVRSDWLKGAAEHLSDADAGTVQRVPDAVLIQPTSTTHPTEAQRKSMKAILRTVASNIKWSTKRC